jgi:uncharacterized protein YbbK (DUF523 family)
MSKPPVRIGISSCLLGEKVRYDGGHKRNTLLIDILGPQVEWVAVCPEVELGLGVPREPLNLIRLKEDTRMVFTVSGEDITDRMRRYARERVGELAKVDLSGYVLKTNSPSCGMQRVPFYGASGQEDGEGRGLFAQVLMEKFPDLPIEEEGRLLDSRLCENFIERVFAFHDRFKLSR